MIASLGPAGDSGNGPGAERVLGSSAAAIDLVMTVEKVSFLDAVSLLQPQLKK